MKRKKRKKKRLQRKKIIDFLTVISLIVAILNGIKNLFK